MCGCDGVLVAVSAGLERGCLWGYGTLDCVRLDCFIHKHVFSFHYSVLRCQNGCESGGCDI